MKVKELVAELLKRNQEANVFIQDADTQYILDFVVRHDHDPTEILLIGGYEDKVRSY